MRFNKGNQGPELPLTSGHISNKLAREKVEIAVQSMTLGKLVEVGWDAFEG